MEPGPEETPQMVHKKIISSTKTISLLFYEIVQLLATQPENYPTLIDIKTKQLNISFSNVFQLLYHLRTFEKYENVMKDLEKSIDERKQLVNKISALLDPSTMAKTSMNLSPDD